MVTGHVFPGRRMAVGNPHRAQSCLRDTVQYTIAQPGLHCWRPVSHCACAACSLHTSGHNDDDKDDDVYFYRAKVITFLCASQREINCTINKNLEA